MDCYAVLGQAIALLQREGRVSYRALKRQFALDDDYLADLKIELIDVKRVAVDLDGAMLIWTGPEATVATPSVASPTIGCAAVEVATTDSIAPPPPEPERRQLTVLFCDLVDSTR